MTDPTKSNPDELDAGWDVSPVPNPSPPVQSQPPTAVLAAIDEGWDPPEPMPDRVSSSQGATPNRPAHQPPVIGEKPRLLSKKDRRRLEREARAHQVARDEENRKQRKAERQQLTEQRASELEAEREQLRQREQEQKLERAARRAKSKHAKSKQPKSQNKVAPPTELQPVPVMSEQTQPGAPNRAARRAKSASNAAVSRPMGAPSASAKKQYAIGPFALFIGVVLVASLLSYYFIR